jgi:hypothetical protein
VTQGAAGLTDLGSEDVKAIPADRLLATETSYLLGSMVERGDTAVVIGRKHSVRDAIEDDGRDSSSARFHVVIRLVMFNAAGIATSGFNPAARVCRQRH